MARKNKALGEIEAMKSHLERELAMADASRQALVAQLDTLTKLQARIVNEGFKLRGAKRKTRTEKIINDLAAPADEYEM